MFGVEQKKMQTGNLGEKLVARYYRDSGCIVEESLDLYDHKKDMIIYDRLFKGSKETGETKTQQAWHTENGFTVKANQIAKCQEVDLLNFVDTPSKYNGMSVILYEFPKEKRKFYRKQTADGRVMYILKKTLGNVLTICKDPAIIQQFIRYSNSSWVK